MTRREIYDSLIRTRAWRNLRMAKLRACEGFCEYCRTRGILTPATEIHHIRPVESGRNAAQMERLCYDIHNLRALCRECHQAAHQLLGKYTPEVKAERNREHTSLAIARLFGEKS